jgi:hypothetical protein
VTPLSRWGLVGSARGDSAMATETLSNHTVLMLKRVTEEEVLYGAYGKSA